MPKTIPNAIHRRLSSVILSVAILVCHGTSGSIQAQSPSASGAVPASAEYASYLAHIAAANYAIRLGESGEAKGFLSACPGPHTQLEWRLLNGLADSATRRLDTGNWTPVKLDFRKDGEQFCVAGDDGLLRIYQTSSLTLVQEIRCGQQAVYAASYDPTGERIAVCNRDGKLSLWQVATGEKIWEKDSGGQGLADIAIHPNGTELAFCSWFRGPETVLGIVSTWNLESGVQTWKTEFGVKPIVTVRYSPDGSKLAVGTWDALVGIWPTKEKTEPQVLNYADVAAYSAIDEICFSSDSKRIAAASKSGFPRVWNLESNEIETEFRGTASAVFSVTFATDALLACGDSNGTVTLWDSETGNAVARWLGHENRILNIALHPDRQTLVTASSDKSIRFWNLQQLGILTQEGQSDYVYGLTMSDDGRWMATGGQSPSVGTGWQTADLSAVSTLGGIEGSINFLDFGADRLVAGGNWSGDVLIWDVATGLEVRRMDSQTKEGIKVGGMQQCSYSSDGKWLASATNKNQVVVWNAELGTIETLLTLETGCWGIDFSSDNRQLAVGDGKGAIHIYSTSDWKEILKLPGHDSLVYALKFSADNLQLASGTESGRLTVYDLKEKAERFSVIGHTQRIWTLGFSADGNRLATGGADGKVKFWDLETGQSLLALADTTGSIYNLLFTADGRTLFLNDMRRQRQILIPQ